MKYSFKTRFVILCLLLSVVLTVVHILVWALVVRMPEVSQKLDAAVIQKIWVIMLLAAGLAMLLSLTYIFRIMAPRFADPVISLFDACAPEIGSGTETPTPGVNDEFTSLSAYIVSLQEQLQAKRDSLSKERNLLRSLIDTLPDLIYIKDTEHRFIVANVALARHVGVETSDELLGKSDIDLLPFKFAGRYYEDERNVLENGEALLDRIEPGVELKSGAKHWFLSSKIPYYDHQGKVEGIIGIGRDITRLEHELEALQEIVAGLSWENLFLSEGRKLEHGEETEQ